MHGQQNVKEISRTSFHSNPFRETILVTLKKKEKDIAGMDWNAGWFYR